MSNDLLLALLKLLVFKLNRAKKVNDKDLVVWKFIAWSIYGVMWDGGHVAVRGCWGMGQRPM